MSDWDASSGDEAPPKAAPAVSLAGGAVPRRRFDDEDAEEEIKDDWESSDDESKTKAASSSTSAAVPPPRKKKSVKQKIAEKEEEERRRAQQALTMGQEPEDGVDPMEYDPIARKRALQQAEIDADVESAASLLGFASVSKDSTATSLSSAKPSSKEEWEQLAAEIFVSILKTQSSRDPTGYAKHFVPALTRQLVAPTRDVDIRKLSTSVKTWAEEKTKADKEAKKSGGRANLAVAAATGGATGAAKPKTVGTASAKNTYDLGAYGDEVLDDGDDLDFM